MDLSGISTLIGSVGFPIAAFILMFWMCNNTLETLRTAVEELKDAVQELKTRID